MSHFACDVCGADNPIEIAVLRKYTGGQPIHTCGQCGLVYITERRSATEIASNWTAVYRAGTYTCENPYVIARLSYVAAWLDQTIGLQGKHVYEIGAGEGWFLRHVLSQYSATGCGMEPTGSRHPGVDACTVEEYGGLHDKSADIVAILWTLENCQNPRTMLEVARRILKPDGHLVIATGSRILVPFQKPLGSYISRLPTDMHATRWSFQSLMNIGFACGFEPKLRTPYQSCGILGSIFTPTIEPVPMRPGPEDDDPLAVCRHFNEWDRLFP